MARSPRRSRGEREYAKPPLRHEQLLERLVARGLRVTDPDRALRYLTHIGYYRFSPYLIPFREHTQVDRLRPGVTFDDVLNLYVFDRRLRLLVLDAVERVEIALRAAITDHMSVRYDDPFWYTDLRHFRSASTHAELLRIVGKTVDSQLEAEAESPDTFSHASALEHYLTQYGTPKLPPSWLMIETLTMGQLERLLANLDRRADRSVISRSFRLPEPLLMSWTRSYVRVRNVCAHHGRLWNVGLGVYPQLPKSATVPWLADPSVIAASPGRSKRLYPVLVSLQSMLVTISPGATWARRLSDLLRQHPDVPLTGMGIPVNWRDDPFWVSRL